MGYYNQQGQWVGGNQLNAERDINQYIHQHYEEKEPRSLSAVEIFAVILLSLVGIVFFFGGFALGIYGFGSSFGVFETVEVLQGVPRTILGVIGVVLLLTGFGIFTYLSIQYPQLNNNKRR